MKAIKTLLAVSVLAAAGAANAATVNFTVAVDSANSGGTFGGSAIPASVSGGGTGSLDTSTGILTFTTSNNTSLDLSTVFSDPAGTDISAASPIVQKYTIATTGAYTPIVTGSSYVTTACTNAATDTLGSCGSAGIGKTNKINALSGSFTTSGGEFVVTTGAAGVLTNVAYKLTATAPAVPVPAAAWLFGSGLLGLAGTARRRRAA